HPVPVFGQRQVESGPEGGIDLLPRTPDHPPVDERLRLRPRKERSDSSWTPEAEEPPSSVNRVLYDYRILAGVDGNGCSHHRSEETIRRPVGRYRNRPGHFASAFASAFGLASTPASLRCWAVIGAGAWVRGSYPPPDLGKAMTSRI